MENDWMEIWLPSVLQVMIFYRHNSSILPVDQLMNYFTQNMTSPFLPLEKVVKYTWGALGIFVQ